MTFPKWLSAGALLVSLVQAEPASAHYPRWFGRRHWGLFNQCGAPLNACCPPVHTPACGPVCAPACAPSLPMDPCGCGPVMQPMYQTQLQAVPQTTLVPQQVVTYQTVPQIQYQRQAYIEQVPVTTMQNVTRYRDVAVQVHQQVAQMQTQLVPQQTLSYVPVTTQVGTQFAGWQPLGYTAYQGGVPGLPMTVGGIVPIPESAGLPQSGIINQPVPYLQGASAADEWSTIRQSGVPAAQAPTAATVWQSQLQTGVLAR